MDAETNSFFTGGARHSRQEIPKSQQKHQRQDKVRKRGRPFKHVSELATTKTRARVQALEAFKQQKIVMTSSEPKY
jgi:hypothetical protein